MSAFNHKHEPGPADTRRIAILLTNNDPSDFSRQFHNDGEKVGTLLRDHRPHWLYEVFSVKDDQFPDIGVADGFVITGSPASVHDPLPWIAKLEHLVRDLNERRIPTVGLCFGHQVIATALGGQVGQNPGGWRFGVAVTLFPTDDSPMLPGVRRLRLHACHSEQVTVMPPDAQWLGGDTFCPNASFAVGRHVITTQYHPEFTHEFMVALADAYQGEVPDHILAAGRREIEGSVDASLFADWAVRFFERTEAATRPVMWVQPAAQSEVDPARRTPRSSIQRRPRPRSI